MFPGPRSTHPDGELAVAMAARHMGVAYVVAHYSGYSLEDILRVCGAEGPKRLLFQLYPPRRADKDVLDREYCVACFKHLAGLGWRGVSVTVDTVNNGNREKTSVQPAAPACPPPPHPFVDAFWAMGRRSPAVHACVCLVAPPRRCRASS